MKYVTITDGKITSAPIAVKPSDQMAVFAVWWKETGQFVCASGQDEHKMVIFEAFVAGWHSCLMNLTQTP